MKYENYKLLTPEQKEEYNYRFKDKKITFRINLLPITLLIAVFGLITLIIYSASTDKIDLHLELTEYYMLLNKIVTLFLVLYVIEVFLVIMYNIILQLKLSIWYNNLPNIISQNKEQQKNEVKQNDS